MAQTPTLTAVLMVCAVLLLCIVGVVLIFESRRPDPKMAFLVGLLNAAIDAEGGREGEPAEVRLD
jgi:hypothetical protein